MYLRIRSTGAASVISSAESVALNMFSALREFDYLVVDLKRVVATDSASNRLFAELSACLTGEGKQLFFADCRHLYRFTKQLQREQGAGQQPLAWLHFEDTDHAVEWCEDRVIAAMQAARGVDGSVAELADQYLCSNMTSEDLAALRDVGDERRISAGTLMFRAGDPAESLYFIYSGEVEVWIDSGSGHHLRVTTLGPGMVVGEVALLNQNRRTANVSTAKHTDCLELRFDAIPEALRTKMLVNMASYFARKIDQDTRLIQRLG
jgi:glutaminase